MKVDYSNYMISGNYKSNVAFKGYDARPLKYILMRDSYLIDTLPAAKEIEKIGKKHGFGMLFEGYEMLEKIPSGKFNSRMIQPWIQDYVHILKDKLMTVNGFNRPKLVEKFFNKSVKNMDCHDFVKGGNLFFVKKDGAEKIIVGQNDYAKAKKMFKTDDIISIPQADYHIDLFIRPLKDGKILVADDRITLSILNNARKILAKEQGLVTDDALAKLDCVIKSMKNALYKRPCQSSENVIKKLEKEGFSVIRVPGRIVKDHESSDIKNLLNFMNAIVHENSKGDLVYITNNSGFLRSLGLDKKIVNHIGLNFEKIFKDSVQEYIKPKNIYFIKGGKEPESEIDFILKSQDGGIHCMTCEIPQDVL